jgi:predicted dehydrogenase
MARRLGLQGHHERCHTCPEKAGCAFFIDLGGNASLKALYLEQEGFDGYIRDRCVFRPDIDIEDTMNAQVRYDNGVLLNYSLNAFCAWEGYTIAFNGTQGRLEHSVCETAYVSGSGTVEGSIARNGVTTRIVPLRGVPRAIEPWPDAGSHGGGDSVMLGDLFRPTPPDDRFLRAADERAGAASILVGVAANRCLETGRPVAIADLVPELERPDYPPMPARDGPLAMPERSGRV